MKKILGFVAMAALLFTFACGGAETPEKVAEKFAKAMAKKDWDAAKKVSTEKTHEMIDMMKQFAGSEAGKDITCEDMKCEVEGETAKCTYTTEGKAESVNLVKVDGKWLVEEKKEMGF